MKIKNKSLSDKSRKWLKRHVEDEYVKKSSKDNYRSFDTKTGFQTNHISNRHSGEWQKAFSEKEIEIINSDLELNNFLKEYNYS